MTKFPDLDIPDVLGLQPFACIDEPFCVIRAPGHSISNSCDFGLTLFTVPLLLHVYDLCLLIILASWAPASRENALLSDFWNMSRTDIKINR